MCAAEAFADQLAALERRALASPRDARLQLAIGQTLQQLDRGFDALLAYERALELDDRLGVAWTLRGHLLRQAGRNADASVCFRHAIACGEDAQKHAYFLSALGLGALPDAAPLAYVRELFDDYAGHFEGHLVDTLHYRGHLEVTQPLAALAPAGGFGSTLDLGCGSGLAGPALRPLTAALTGVDLSARMIEAARATGLYDTLLHDDLLAHLRATPQRHSLVVACDVFIYLGDLAPVFEAVHGVLAPGGVFAFSVEGGHAGTGFDLLASLRYCHSETYLRRLAQAGGWCILRCERAALREDRGDTITGLYLHLARA